MKTVIFETIKRDFDFVANALNSLMSERIAQANNSEESAEVGVSQNELNELSQQLLGLVAKVQGLGGAEVADGCSLRDVRISVEPVLVTKYRKSVRQYGIVVSVGGTKVPITFTGSDQTMLYLSAIVRYKVGQPLYVHEFYNNSKGLCSIYKRGKSYGWLNRLFNTVVSRELGAFKRWLDNVQDSYKKGRALYQAKSQTAAIVKGALKSHPKAQEACLLQLQSDAAGDTYYSFACPRENISICEELQGLMNEFEVLYSTAC